MAKIFRFSGYFVDGDIPPFNLKGFTNEFTENMLRFSPESIFQQLHIEESEEFKINGELEENCDLALLTRHFKHDNKDVEYDRPLPQKGNKYRHFKLGKIVEIVGVSRHTETEEISVIYDYEGHLWNRPLEMFMSEVDRDKYSNAEQRYRFELVEE